MSLERAVREALARLLGSTARPRERSGPSKFSAHSALQPPPENHQRRVMIRREMPVLTIKFSGAILLRCGGPTSLPRRFFTNEDAESEIAVPTRTAAADQPLASFPCFLTPRVFALRLFRVLYLSLVVGVMPKLSWAQSQNNIRIPDVAPATGQFIRLSRVSSPPSDPQCPSTFKAEVGNPAPQSVNFTWTNVTNHGNLTVDPLDAAFATYAPIDFGQGIIKVIEAGAGLEGTLLYQQANSTVRIAAPLNQSEIPLAYGAELPLSKFDECPLGGSYAWTAAGRLTDGAGNFSSPAAANTLFSSLISDIYDVRLTYTHTGKMGVATIVLPVIKAAGISASAPVIFVGDTITFTVTASPPGVNGYAMLLSVGTVPVSSDVGDVPLSVVVSDTAAGGVRQIVIRFDSAGAFRAKARAGVLDPGVVTDQISVVPVPPGP